MGHGTKSSAQLDREVNDILVARQKREARARAGQHKPVPDADEVMARMSGYTTQAPGRRVPSPSEYERRELREANHRLSEVEQAPLADRKEAGAELLAAMRNHPDLVAERLGWLLGGNYGYGPMLMARRVLGSPRMNRSAALTHMVAAFEWSSPSALTRAAWKKLTKGQQAALERAVQAVIRSTEREEA